ncbi:MAG: trigger factor [Candidatus Omnitrophica bacterium]|nr:trigger factor [Candidatus Omnitrophota bacterium]MDD5355374.1 trigger factor [Candidatus Omnitrophota bacterium]
MKVKVNKLDTLKRELEIEVGQDKVKEKFDAVYEEIKQNVKIPGFRPGTAPRNILEKHHSKLAHEEVLKHLLPETYHDALEKEKIDAVSLPQITEVSLDNNFLKYKAILEIRPDIEIKNYKKIKIKKKSNEVNEEDLNKVLDNIKQARKSEAIDDNFAHGLGYSNLNDFKDALKRQLAIQKEQENRMQLEKEIIDHLLKNSKFNVPGTLVDRRFSELKQNVKEYMENNKIPREEAEKKEKELEPKLKGQAEEEVKIFLVLDEIAKIESITRDEHMPQHVMEFLFKNAEWSE